MTLVAALLAAYWMTLLARALRWPQLLAEVPAAGGDAAERTGWPTASILVAVRNEMHRTLDDSIAGLLAQDYPGFEIVAVDDHSEDGSRARLEQLAASGSGPRLRVLGADPGARGKRMALAQASRAARGSWLLFTDADVQLAPDALARGVALARRAQIDALSLLPRTHAVSLWEQIALAAIAWTAYEGGALRRCNRDDAPVGLAAAGPYLLVRRETFDAVGGYEAMRQNVLVDVALARRLRDAGFRYRYLASGGCVHARMYRSLPEIWQGFGKNAYLALGGRIDIALGAAVALGTLVVLPPVLGLLQLVRGELAAGSLALAAWVGMTAVAQRGSVFMGTRVRWPALLLSPIGALLWIAIVAHSAWRAHSRSGVRWKDRSLPVVEPAGRE